VVGMGGVVGVLGMMKRISILISRRMRLLVLTMIVGTVGMGARVGPVVLLVLAGVGRCLYDDEGL
jgi:hypothetical protein